MEVSTSQDKHDFEEQQWRIRTNNAQGHVFAGATLPFGLAKAVADSVNDNAGGYASDGGPSKFHYKTKK
jgi:putative alpha-1,2-mannosidase